MKTILTVLCAAVLCASCGSAPAPAEMAVNTRCPMMTDHDVDPEVTRTYAGKKVAFCCAKCAGKFEAMSDAEKDAALEAVAGR